MNRQVGRESTKTGGYRYVLLVILMMIYTYHIADRVALSLVLQNIKADLQLSDTELGLLTGIAFALFFSTMGIPIARWADRGNRVTIIALTTTVWSALVLALGMATNLLQLLLLRTGAGIGEAGCVPTAQSLIADYFTQKERPRALALYFLGGPLAMVIGNYGAGWINQLYGWRVVFMFLGAPGIIFAALAWAVLREPRCARPPHGETGVDHSVVQPRRPGFWEACATLFNIPTFRHLLVCLAVLSFFGQGIFIWLPTYFTRSFHLTSGALGTWLAVVYGGCTAIGILGGGELVTRYLPGNETLQVKLIAILIVAFTFLYMLVFLSDSYIEAFALLSIATIIGSTIMSPIYAAIHSMTPSSLRATAIAIVLLCINLIGMGFGPLVAGVLSDLFQSWSGDDSLRYAALTLCPGCFLASWHMWAARKTIAQDVNAVQADGQLESMPNGAIAADLV